MWLLQPQAGVAPAHVRSARRRPVRARVLQGGTAPSGSGRGSRSPLAPRSRRAAAAREVRQPAPPALLPVARHATGARASRSARAWTLMTSTFPCARVVGEALVAAVAWLQALGPMALTGST